MAKTSGNSLLGFQSLLWWRQKSQIADKSCKQEGSFSVCFVLCHTQRCSDAQGLLLGSELRNLSLRTQQERSLQDHTLPNLADERKRERGKEKRKREKRQGERMGGKGKELKREEGEGKRTALT